ncbi:4-hydroxybenzoate octaprenyltransferase [Aestuariirhabdus sp. Z084]|uniref:4-hydroxybenzoate octaprenyltransferase n=1 Tax=Aestuariirhabdus haliotis TaxID=2918751 RepID=UPI00201B38B0|nr:4-hydroxybenzoate octaprenyltransferase [Aestuariirhabdus haliotis]MCL6414318.1 4-hydroxybenzoate octaprenyltransferase [Aestuariirhabdus haliotis]MCL6418250.1 4-hydroxybenzoate octaprenyltransferase [Aestuariirhabdus haliotis]
MQWILERYPRLPDFIALTRLNKPIGIYLLLWPTLWALWAAAEGLPRFDLLLIFILGTVLMRSAGCVINDYADRDFDGLVERTRDRPLAQGRIQPREALVLFSVMVGLAFVLVLFTNPLTVYLSVGGLLLAACYPFMKRYTHLPQVVLGAAFAWSIPMAWAAQNGEVAPVAGLLYIATLMWTVAYDTQYAMVDREDDLKAGIKSTAILFGEADNTMIAILQGFTLLVLLMVADQLVLGPAFYLGLAAACGLFVYQYRLTRGRKREECFKAFLNNHWVGLVIFLGLFVDYGLRTL